MEGRERCHSSESFSGVAVTGNDLIEPAKLGHIEGQKKYLTWARFGPSAIFCAATYWIQSAGYHCSELRAQE